MESFIKSITVRMLANYIYDFNCKRKLGLGIPVIIYQVGKVGSRSIFTSLKKAGCRSLFHTHTIRHDHALRSIQRLFDYICIRKNRVKIISLTREPFSRNVSSFFQTIKKYISPARALEDYSVEELIKVYFEKFPRLEPILWFDCELRRITGINIYEHQLVDNSHVRVTNDNIDLLVLKLESSNELKEDLINEFLEISSFKIHSTNISSQKNYHNKYLEFKSSITYTMKQVEEMVGSDYFQFFYGSEKDDILKRNGIEQ
jgi:hypothetical protein